MLVYEVGDGNGEVAVSQEPDGEADSHRGGGDRDDEEREHLPRDLPRERGERDQVDVDGVEHELDREQHEDTVAAGEHARDAAPEHVSAAGGGAGYGPRPTLPAEDTDPTHAASSA